MSDDRPRKTPGDRYVNQMRKRVTDFGKTLHSSSPLRILLFRCRDEIALARWLSSDRSKPGPALWKRYQLRRLADIYGLTTVVETGTYRGDTTAFMFRGGCKVHTIELDHRLAREARLRFARTRQVTVHEGDSSVLLRGIVADLNEPALLWLDAHWSSGITARGAEDTPVWDEIRVALEDGENHVIAIDDAQDFTGTNGYPFIGDLGHAVKSLRPDYHFVTHYGMIIIAPPG